MTRICLLLIEYCMSLLSCLLINVDMLREAIDYLLLAVTMLLIRYLTYKVEKILKKRFNKDKKNE